MAKRLNKKVALIGSVVFVFLMLAAILVILYWGDDPEKFIKDGDIALEVAKQATDSEIRANKYEEAERNYLRANAQAKTNPDRIKILFKLVDMYIEADQWPKVLGCWKEIVSIDPKNFDARLGQLKYFYSLADSSARLMGDSGTGIWQEIQSQATEFIDVADADLLAQDITQRESFGIRDTTDVRHLGTYLYMLRGRATLELARMGAGTDPVEAITQAVDDLEKVRELESDNVDVYWYLAQAVIARGENIALGGNFEEREKAADEAVKYLEDAVRIADENVKAHVNLLMMKLMLARISVTDRPRERIRALEPEYLSLVRRFESSALAYSALVEFYHFLGPQSLDKAIEAIEKAVELDRENVGYAITAANLHYRKFSVYGEKPQLYKAIETAESALTLPDAQDKAGPRYLANRVSRILLYTFLADCYIEQVLEPCEARTDSQKQQWLSDAEEAVHQIEQLYGSGEHPKVIKWRAMLELAKGNKNLAIRELYATYEQLKASGQREVQIPYTLAKLFKNTSELGAVAEYLNGALGISDGKKISGIDESKPEVFLDYAEVLLKLDAFGSVLSVVNFFEENYWSNERSRELRIYALIGATQLNDVEKELANTESWPPDDPNTIQLKLLLLNAKIGQLQRNITNRQMGRDLDVISQVTPAGEQQQTADRLMAAELDDCWSTSVQLLEKLLVIEPNSVPTALVIAACNNYIQREQIGRISGLVDQYLERFPDSPTLLFYKGIISEPEPNKISPERRIEIELQALSSITDPIRRAMNLGVFYQRNKELGKAVEEFKKILRMQTSPSGVIDVPAFDKTERINESQHLATNYLFDVVLEAENWQLAEQIAVLARRENIDECNGVFFAARLDAAKTEYSDALAKLNECLKQRPIFSFGYLVRGKVNAALDNERAAIEDIKKAVSLNPIDGIITKELAFVLYRRNEKLGNNVSADQVIEVKDALIKAIRLNPAEWQLQSFFAEYIGDENPDEALVIRQRLQKVIPTTENALMLGNMAMRMALKEISPERKKILFSIANSAFKQALDIDPQNKEVVDSLAEYYRLTGQEEQARQLLTQSQDSVLLYAHYIRTGKFDDARKIAERLYKADSKDVDAVKALLLVAERTNDRQGVEKYSQELLLLDDSVENYLVQIQAFLTIGLLKEAEYKLQSFKERIPYEPRVLLLEASLVMRQGRLKEALELTNQALQSDQNSAVAWRLRGEINLALANYEQAISDIKKGRSLAEEVTAPIALAKAYLKTGRQGDAIIELKSAISGVEEFSVQPKPIVNSVPYNEQKARLLLEQIYLQLDRRKELKQFYDETLERFPNDVFWYNQAGALALSQRDFIKAEQLYERAWQNSLKVGDGDLMAFDGYLQALLLNASNNPQKLNKVLEEGGKHVNDDFAPVAYLRMAEAKFKLRDNAAVTQYCREALHKVGVNKVLVPNILRRMYLLLGADGVLQICKEGLEADPDSLDANYIMFNFSILNSEYNKALGYIDKCLQIAGSDSTLRIDLRIQKAMLLQSAYTRASDNNYLKMAVIEYESLLAEMPNNTIVLNNLAYMLAENDERLTEALQYAKRAYELSPNNPGFMDTYSYVLYKNGKFEEAAEFLQASLQQYEQGDVAMPAEVYEHLGMIKEKFGHKIQALAAYKQALEVGGDRLSDEVKGRLENAIGRLSN